MDTCMVRAGIIIKRYYKRKQAGILFFQGIPVFIIKFLVTFFIPPRHKIFLTISNQFK